MPLFNTTNGTLTPGLLAQSALNHGKRVAKKDGKVVTFCAL
jgi:hypothetical protein